MIPEVGGGSKGPGSHRVFIEYGKIFQIAIRTGVFFPTRLPVDEANSTAAPPKDRSTAGFAHSWFRLSYGNPHPPGVVRGQSHRGCGRLRRLHLLQPADLVGRIFVVFAVAGLVAMTGSGVSSELSSSFGALASGTTATTDSTSSVDSVACCADA